MHQVKGEGCSLSQLGHFHSARFVYFWPVSSSSQCCSSQLTHQMLHTSIGRVRRQLSVPTILTETVHNVQSWTKMLRKMDFPMSSFKIKLLKALVITNTSPPSSPPKKNKKQIWPGWGGGRGHSGTIPLSLVLCTPLSPGLFVFLPLETEEDNDNPWNEVAFVFRHFFHPKCRVTRY